MIPESVTELYEAVKPLREEMERLAGLEDADVFSPEYREALRTEMEKHFPNLQRFEAAMQTFYAKGGREMSREEGWPHLRDVAATLISDHTLDVER